MGTVPFFRPPAVSQRMEAAALLLFLPAVWFAVWPYRLAPLLVVLGLALRLLPLRKRWSGWLANGAVTAGVVLLVQALVLELYAIHTARSHDLPYPLPDVLAGVAGLLGIAATADGSAVVMQSLRQTHRLAATWELLLDPATLLFFVGGLTIACGFAPAWRDWIRTLRTLTLIVLAWLPVRAGLLMAVYLHRVLRSDPAQPLHAMNHFFSPWVLLGLLVVLVLLAWRFVRNPKSQIPNPKSEGSLGTEVPSPPPSSPFRLFPSPFRLLLSAGLIALGVAIWTAAIYWNPVGARRGGRVTVVERHSKWEPTTKPYDTKWFAEPPLFGEASGYNYAAIYDYLGQYYQMSRLLEGDKIDEQTLARCDVLVIKIPTERYSPEEAQAVTRFVERGGGLLLIGDHTDFSRSSTAMNDVTRPMGFIFRDDLLFGLGRSWDEEHYVPPLLPHPIVAHMPPMDFAVSCSIDPGRSHGRAAMVNTGLWSMGPDYHADNFHPVPQHCPEMCGGAFIQVWAAWYGQGRAMAYTDSTIFSNFCTFQPGHAEIMLGMIEWLNHANPWLDPRPWLLLLGLLPLVAGIWLVQRPTTAVAGGGNAAAPPAIAVAGRCAIVNPLSGALLLLAAGTCGWVAGGLAVNAANRSAAPPPDCLRPQPCVVIDRTTSAVPLAEGMFLAAELAEHRRAAPPSPKGMFPRDNDKGYGMLEAWIPRIGCYTIRKEGDEAFSGDALVVICPNRMPPEQPEEFRRRGFRSPWIGRLVEYVRGGGKLLVIDTPENAQSTANVLLEPFGLSVRRNKPWMGKLSTVGQTALVEVESAWEVAGGQPLARLDKLPVAATVQYGKGSVMAVGFGSLWNDTRLGETWMIEPDAAVKARYEVLFGLLRTLLEGKPPAVPPAPKKPAADLPLKESGPAEL